jgi:DNA-binding NarL/FixJ family response regulator
VTTRVVVVDDQELVRAGFVALLASSPDLEVVGEAGQGDEAVRLVRRELPDVVLMDVRMPVLDGIEATRQILADPRCGQVKVIVLTTFAIDEYVFGALRCGVVGFLLKDTPPADLIHAVQVAAAGDALLSPSITKRLIEAYASTESRPAFAQLPDLTDRENDVLALVARGLSNAEIAAELHLGVATVKTYVSRLLEKTGATTRVHLVIQAYESGLLLPGISVSAPVDTKS